MSIEPVCDAAEIAEAILTFDKDYHADFFGAYDLATEFLATSRADKQLAIPLCSTLSSALRNWGAEMRKAPTLVSQEQLVSALLEPATFDRLRYLRSFSLSDVGLDQRGRRQVFATQAVSPTTLDSSLTSLIGDLHRAIFVGNTNVTYPMKALLLLTGFMPAYDSQVRKGLERCGMGGFAGTRFLIETNPARSGAKKVARLPYLLGDCFRLHEPLFQAGIRRSPHSRLAGIPGRLFDVLLFIQGSTERRLLTFENGDARRWYELRDV